MAVGRKFARQQIDCLLLLPTAAVSYFLQRNSKTENRAFLRADHAAAETGVSLEQREDAEIL